MAASAGELFTTMSPFAAAPKWTMPGRWAGEGARPGQAPGPGAYDSLRGMKSSSAHPRPPSAGFGSGTRDGGGHRPQAPGPGTYTRKDPPASPTFSIGTSTRPGSAPAGGRGPGPGAYDLRSTLRDKGVSIAARNDHDPAQRQRAKDPGPGAYTNKEPPGSPKFSFGTGQRPGLSTPQQNPGPGTYQPGKDPRQIRPPTYTLLPRREDPSVRSAGQLGGGAMYGPFTDLGKGPKYSIGGGQRSAEQGSATRGPGPGAYQKVAFEKSSRIKRSPSATFGAGLRDGPNQSSKGPGPGQYEPKNPFGAPKFSIGSSVRPSSAPPGGRNPGPGTYTPLSGLGTSKNAGISISQRIADPQSRNPAPGPGAYNPKPSLGTEPKFSFGAGQRGGLSDGAAKAPGPGTYQVPSGLRGGGVSMAPRRDDSARLAKGSGSMYGPFTQFGR